MRGGYLGPEYSSNEIAQKLIGCNAVFTTHTPDEIIDKAAHSLAEGKAIGWMNGRMEFGPRSLGGRSILADPRSPKMQKQLNLKVKFRESFRPFAPSILREHLDEWFDIDVDSPYMLFVANVKKNKMIGLTPEEQKLFGIAKLNTIRSEIPSVMHVDYSARIQTVHSETNPRFHQLLNRFYELTGCPILVNTSFNVRGEPIVCTPEDAFRCFMGTDLDALVVGDVFLEKKQQHESLISTYKDSYELD